MYICVPTPVGSGVEKSATSDSIVDIPNTRTRNGLTTLRNCLTTIIGSYFITNYPVPRVQSLRGRPLAASCLPPPSCIVYHIAAAVPGRRAPVGSVALHPGPHATHVNCHALRTQPARGVK